MKRDTLFLTIIFTLSIFALTLNADGKEEKPIGVAVEFTSHSACGHIAKNKGWFKGEGINLRTYDSYVTKGRVKASSLYIQIGIGFI